MSALDSLAAFVAVFAFAVVAFVVVYAVADLGGDVDH